MRLPARFRLKAFPEDKRLWKVDWFGDLLPNPNAKSEPLLEVFIVPFIKNEISSGLLKRKSSYDYKLFRKIEIGVSLLPFLHLGTFWRNGIHQIASLSERFTLNKLKIDDSNTRVISAVNSKAYKNLVSVFPSIARCPETNLLEIDFPSNAKQKILIPCYEVLRTYYAGSSPLTRRIITGGIGSRYNDLFDPKQTNLDKITGIGRLILRKKLAKSDRYNVARIAFSKIATNATWRIYSSIVKNFNNNNRFITEVTFPFVGETNLQVCGKWFKQDKLWHLLVYFIESCDYPFPYKQLIWGVEGEKEITNNPQSEKEYSIRQIINKDQNDRNVHNYDEPDLQSIFNEVFFDGQKFLDLENKEREKRLIGEPTETGFNYKIITEKTNEPRDLSTGEGTFGTSSKQGLIIKIGEDKGIEEPEKEIKETSNTIPAGWGLFIGILHELEEKVQIQTKVVNFLSQSDDCSKGNVANGIYFPIFLHGKRMSWSYLDKMRTHRRQAMLAEVLIGKRYFYLFDTEVKTEDINDRYSMMLIYNPDYSKIKEDDWRILLSDAVMFRGKKRNKWRWHKVKWKNFRHDLNDTRRYAERLFDFAVSQLRKK